VRLTTEKTTENSAYTAKRGENVPKLGGGNWSASGKPRKTETAENPSAENRAIRCRAHLFFPCFAPWKTRSIRMEPPSYGYWAAYVPQRAWNRSSRCSSWPLMSTTAILRIRKTDLSPSRPSDKIPPDREKAKDE